MASKSLKTITFGGPTLRIACSPLSTHISLHSCITCIIMSWFNQIQGSLFLGNSVLKSWKLPNKLPKVSPLPFHLKFISLVPAPEFWENNRRCLYRSAVLCQNDRTCQIFLPWTRNSSSFFGETKRPPSKACSRWFPSSSGDRVLFTATTLSNLLRTYTFTNLWKNFSQTQTKPTKRTELKVTWDCFGFTK